MSDALPLPSCPNIEQYKKLAKELQHAFNSGDQDAVRAWAVRLAQKTARPEEAERLAQHWRQFKNESQGGARCTLAEAQFFLARRHGFASWPNFVRHLQALLHSNSEVGRFEAAADAIVNGDFAVLAKLLGSHPALARARSTREHHSTLLHYVSANGVEDFRQRSPKNIVEIATLLLNGGAEVDAASEAYGGSSTTLGLTATSLHPERAGVQLPLLELLIEYGATIDSAGESAVNACLRNGRGPAAEFLAARGARLDLEGAAGVGRLDIVKSFFSEDGNLKTAATKEQMKDGFTWACEFGRNPVIEFLLDRGMDPGANDLRHHGQTGLHWAAFRAEPETVKLLLERNAPVNAKDNTFDGSPLSWALHAWSNEPESAAADSFYQVAALLVAAGATVEPDWLVNPKIRADPKLLSALGR